MKTYHKTYVATVRIMIRPESGENACETVEQACDWMSALLTENPHVLDWAYERNEDGTFDKPREIFVPTDYVEGDFMLDVAD